MVSNGEVSVNCEFSFLNMFFHSNYREINSLDSIVESIKTLALGLTI